MDHVQRRGTKFESPRSIRERCDHCGAPSGESCARWNGGLTLGRRQTQEFGPSDAQLAQLFTRRLHQVAAKVRVLPAAARETMVTTTGELVAELHLLSEEIEERLGR